MAYDLLEALDAARGLAGLPFVVTSGMRCAQHNAACNGSLSSSHLSGLAADIQCSESHARERIIRALMAVDITRIGIAVDFIHADIDEEKPPNRLWLY